MTRTLLLMIIMCILAGYNSFGQSVDVPDQGSLIIYGEGFMFGVHEPYGWIGDIENAEQYFSNVVFYNKNDGLKNSMALIQVLNFNKKDENTAKDLKYDVKSYKNRYKNLTLADLPVSHNIYKCFSRMMYVDNEFYQYTVYVNPGPTFKSGISVSMNVVKRPANNEEIEAFKEIISSLVMMKG